jgi:ADP-ribose pyrophosphatase YjhB (NUDIX family)
MSHSVQPAVRATAVLIEDDHILLVRQRVDATRDWSLPGGKLQAGESLAGCIVREVREETGLLVAVDRFLYLCDRIEATRHVVHVTFAVRRIGGDLRLGVEPEPDANPISAVAMVALASLPAHGFSSRFCALAAAGFPDSGTYQGSVTNIGL